jgi:hypothetical protein
MEFTILFLATAIVCWSPGAVNVHWRSACSELS